MSDNFGGGIYLTTNTDQRPNWDLQTDESGDIRTVTGSDELQKDVAFATAVRVQDSIGERLEPVVLNRIRAQVRGALNEEPRIDTVIIIEANEVDTDTVEVVAQARAEDDTIELVFEVNS